MSYLEFAKVNKRTLNIVKSKLKCYNTTINNVTIITIIVIKNKDHGNMTVTLANMTVPLIVLIGGSTLHKVQISMSGIVFPIPNQS